MEIVKLDPSDWLRYRDLRIESLQIEPQAFGASLRSTLEREDAWWRQRLERAAEDVNETLLFAEEEGQLVGMVGAYTDDVPGVTYVISMYVTSAMRGRGLGRGLLAAVVGEIESQTEPREIRLTVNESQVAAMNLYRSFGFEELLRDMLRRDDGTEYVQFTLRLPTKPA